MPTLSAEAVIQSIRKLAALDLSSSRAAALEAFLTAKRLVVSGGGISINAVNEIVGDLFNVLPDHLRGRIQPFDRNSEASTLAPKWGLRDGSGRMTVWNMTTRGQRNLACKLFQGGDIRHGLLSNAAEILGQELDPRPNAEALAILLLRNEDFPSPLTIADVDALN